MLLREFACAPCNLGVTMSEVAAGARPIMIAKRRARFALLLGAVSFLAVGAVAWQALEAVSDAQAQTAAEDATQEALKLAAAQVPSAPKEIIKVVYVPRPTPAPRAAPQPVLEDAPEAPVIPEALAAIEPAVEDPTPEAPVIEASNKAAPEPASTCVDDLREFAASRTILFNIGSAEVDPGKLPQLRLLGEKAAACDDAVIRVTGHSDSSGSDLINLALSWERADNTIAALESFGLPTQSFEPLGFGARSPVAQGDDADDEQNRRVEFQVLRKSEQIN